LGRASWQRLLWAVITAVILLSFMTPFIMFTISFLMIPVIMLYVKSSTKQFVIYYVGSLLLVYLLSAWQGSFLLSVSLFFLPPVLVLGSMYKRKAPARTVVTIGTLTLLAEALLSLVIGYMVGINPIAKFKLFLNDSLNTVSPELRSLLPKEQEIYINFMSQIIPVALIAFALFFVLVTHGISRWLLNKTGEAIPGLRPMREWMLPKSFVWLYLIAFVADFFINPGSTSLISMLLFNLLSLLVPVFAVQAISFLFYICYVNKWNRALPIIAIVLLVFVPPLFFIFSLLGVFDVAFPIRERFKKKI
jgi:uncharacterized protein YybS (DUF2232 family)